MVSGFFSISSIDVESRRLGDGWYTDVTSHTQCLSSASKWRFNLIDGQIQIMKPTLRINVRPSQKEGFDYLFCRVWFGSPNHQELEMPWFLGQRTEIFPTKKWFPEDFSEPCWWNRSPSKLGHQKSHNPSIRWSTLVHILRSWVFRDTKTTWRSWQKSGWRGQD